MTIDPQIWTLAQARCQASGWNNSRDIQTMAEAIQSAVEDVEADFMNSLDEEDDHVER